MKNLPTFEQFVNEGNLTSFDNVVDAIRKIAKIKGDSIDDRQFNEVIDLYYSYNNWKSNKKPEASYNILHYVLSRPDDILHKALLSTLGAEKIKSLKSNIDYTLKNRCYDRVIDLRYFTHTFDLKEYKAILSTLHRELRSKISELLKDHKITYDIRKSLRNQEIYEVFRTISISSNQRDNVDFVELIAGVDRYQKYFSKSQIRDAKICMEYIKHIAEEGREGIESLELENWDYSSDGEKVEMCAKDFPKEYAFISKFRQEIKEFSTTYLNNLVSIDKTLED